MIHDWRMEIVVVVVVAVVEIVVGCLFERVKAPPDVREQGEQQIR